MMKGVMMTSTMFGQTLKSWMTPLEEIEVDEKLERNLPHNLSSEPDIVAAAGGQRTELLFSWWSALVRAQCVH